MRGVPYTPDCVAEYALTMMLMAARNLGAVLQRAREGDFRLEARRARELREIRVGVVGTGRIGARVIALLRAMGCTVAAYDRTHIANVNYLPLDKLLSWSDLVTLHLPLTPATRHILSEERLARMRPEALLVNVSRGGLIDTPALCNALEQGRLAGAALDVVEGEQDWFYHNRRGETPALCPFGGASQRHSHAAHGLLHPPRPGRRGKKHRGNVPGGRREGRKWIASGC